MLNRQSREKTGIYQINNKFLIRQDITQFLQILILDLIAFEGNE